MGLPEASHLLLREEYHEYPQKSIDISSNKPFYETPLRCSTNPSPGPLLENNRLFPGGLKEVLTQKSAFGGRGVHIILVYLFFPLFER